MNERLVLGPDAAGAENRRKNARNIGRAFPRSGGRSSGSSAPQPPGAMPHGKWGVVLDINLKLSPGEFLELDDEAVVRLIGARYHALRELGCDPEAAVVIAVHPEIRVADAAGLLWRGHDARTALGILLQEVDARAHNAPPQPRAGEEGGPFLTLH